MPAYRAHAVPGIENEELRCVGQFPDGCGALAVDHIQSLNAALMAGLRAAYAFTGGKAGVPFHYDHDLPSLTKSEAANFQKLRYFGLIEKHYDETGLHTMGMWKLTKKGVGFMRGSLYCYPKVWTWRGDPIEWVGEPILVKDANEPTWTREDYAEGLRSHDFGEEETDDQQ